MSIATSLQKVLDSKEAIKTSINNKGGQITSATPFSAYSAAIDNLPSGGGGDGILKSISESEWTGTTFKLANAVTEVVVPSGVTRINNSMAEGIFLKKITLPDTLTTIDQRSFSGCSALESISIPSGVTSIQDATFSGCTSLSSVTLTDSISGIGNDAFGGTLIETIYLNDNISTIGTYAFSGTKLKSITIPSGLTSMSAGICHNCKQLSSVTIPNTITSIASCAFSGCSNLSSITIPNSVTTFGDYVFAYTSRLPSITLGDSVTSIGNYFLNNGYNGMVLTINTVVPPTLGSNAFYWSAYPSAIYVPAESVEAYKAATNWSAYASRIQAIPTA